MRTEIDLQFADGAYRFKLGLAQIREMQAKAGAGIGVIYSRVLAGRMGDRLEEGHPAYGQFHIDDIRETVRQGLIGGGEGRVDGQDVKVTGLRATELVEYYLDAMPLAEQWTLAAAILFACVEGYTDEQSPGDETEPPAPGDEDKKKEGGSTTQAP